MTFEVKSEVDLMDDDWLMLPGPFSSELKANIAKIDSKQFKWENFFLTNITDKNIIDILEVLSDPIEPDEEEHLYSDNSDEDDEEDVSLFEEMDISSNSISPSPQITPNPIKHSSLPFHPSTTTPATTLWNNWPPKVKPSFPFIGLTGLKIFPQDQTPEKYFDLLFTCEFLTNIVLETNVLASELITTGNLKKWKSLTLDELKTFLGIYFHMGIIKPEERLSAYWEKSDLYNVAFFHRLSRDRFLEILQCLHFGRNPAPGEPAPDNPLYKLSPLIEHFHNRMTEIHEPGRNISIDESIVPWWGRSFFRPYKPNRTHQYVIKLYMLAENDGMIHRFLVYAGASDPEVDGQDHASKVVHKLLDGLKNEGRALFVDNFYTSVDLADQLLHENTYITGILRADRKNNPEFVTKKKLFYDEVVQQWTDAGINVSKWRDKRDLLTISTEFSGDLIDTVSRQGFHKAKPQAVCQYNKFMGGVDRSDQMLSCYIGTHKSLKWYKKLGFHIMEIMLLNAYLLYKRYTVHTTPLNLFQFREKIIKYLAPPFRNFPKSPYSPRPRTSTFLNKNHFPTVTEVSQSKRGKRPQKRCRQCSKRKVTKFVTTYCPACPDEPGLCLECFLEYHKDNGFSLL